MAKNQVDREVVTVVPTKLTFLPETAEEVRISVRDGNENPIEGAQIAITVECECGCEGSPLEPVRIVEGVLPTHTHETEVTVGFTNPQGLLIAEVAMQSLWNGKVSGNLCIVAGATQITEIRVPFNID